MRKITCLLISFLLISTSFLSFPTGGGGSSNTVLAQANSPKECGEIRKSIDNLLDQAHKALDKPVEETEKALQLTPKTPFRESYKSAWKDIMHKAAKKGVAKAIMSGRFLGPVGKAFDLWALLWLFDEATERAVKQGFIASGFSEEEAERLAKIVSDQSVKFRLDWSFETLIMNTFSQLEKFADDGWPMCYTTTVIGNPKPPPLPIDISSGLGRKERGGKEPAIFVRTCVTTIEEDGTSDTECKFERDN